MTEVTSPPEPTTPVEAQARLQSVKQDPAWTKAFLEGGPKQLTEFHKLHEMIATPVDVAKAMAGEFMGVNTSEHIQAMGVAAHLRESGLDDAVIKQALTGSPVSRAEYDAVAKWKTSKMADHQFTKALMAGDGEPKRLWRAANIVLANGFKSE
jgi:hypothetical protein